MSVLITKARISLPFSPKDNHLNASPINKEYITIWDTGATHSVITNKVVNDLNLKAISVVSINTAAGPYRANRFLVNIILPNGVVIPNIMVTEGNLGPGEDVLIGMGIISLGDFSISNYKGKTQFCFRIPSIINIDLTQNPNKKINRNAKCPCVSGKKYKQCYGKA